jgi:chemotaxis protein CheD
VFIVGHKDGEIETKSNIHLSNVKGYPAYTIIGGEFAVAKDADNVAFKTLLGSCVAIMFYDIATGIKGMNHFLLPSTSTGSVDMKYGLYSVEAMLNEMYKLGATKKNLRAKIAGGAHILQTHDNRIGDKNVEFAHEFCKTENIKLLGEHVRGVHGRVILLADEFKTFIRSVQNRSIEAKIVSEETTLKTTLKQKPVIEESGGIELF